MSDTDMFVKKAVFNFNSALLVALLAVVGYFGSRICEKVESTHDSLIQLQMTAVTHIEFDKQNEKTNDRLDRIEAILKLNKTQ